MGRGTNDRVTQADKLVIWEVFVAYQRALQKEEVLDYDDYALKCIERIESSNDFAHPFTHIVVDEAQDLTKAQMIVISKLVTPDTNSLSIIADAAQRIYKSGFSWQEVGLNVRGGRTIEFKKNYRNNKHIVKAAMSLLSHDEDRSEFTEVSEVSRDGERPKCGLFSSESLQSAYVIQQLKLLRESGSLGSCVILHRENPGLKRIERSLVEEEFSVELIRDNNKVDYEGSSIKLCTMSSVKGLEFDHVFIIDLNYDVLPMRSQLDEELHISTERRLLYTAMTRSRKSLHLLSSCAMQTPFFEEIDDSLLDFLPDGDCKLIFESEK